MTLPKVTLDGVEYNVVPAQGCSALGVLCCFTHQLGCEERHKFCGYPDSNVFLDDARLLQYLTKRITG